MLTPYSLGKFALLATAALPVTLAGIVSKPLVTLKRDSSPKLPKCATAGDSKWQRAMDFDTDSCYSVAAIGLDGSLNGGQDNCYTTGSGECRDESDLDNSNVYVRARCNNGWCAHMYAYYFEKDVNLEHVCGVGAGHRHDWEHVVVWVKNDEAKYVATSAHGKYHVYPAEDVRWEDTHPKVVYRREGAQTHSLRFASEGDDDIENHKGVWFYSDLVSYFGFPSAELRHFMLYNDWGSATIDFYDGRFATALEDAKGGKDIPLDTSFDNASSPGDPIGC